MPSFYFFEKKLTTFFHGYKLNCGYKSFFDLLRNKLFGGFSWFFGDINCKMFTLIFLKKLSKYLMFSFGNFVASYS